MKSICFVDLETTGADVAADRIVEIAIVRRHESGRVERWHSLVNPGMPIPSAASSVHGISDADVADAPRFDESFARVVLSVLGDADVGGFNVEGFDLPLLRAEFARAGVELPMEGRHVVDVMRLFNAFVKRDLGLAVKLYAPHFRLEAHSASSDAEGSLYVLAGLQSSHAELRDCDAEALAQWRPAEWVDRDGKLRWVDSPKGPLACVSFGKHAGHSLRWLAKHEPGFLQWVLANDFSAEVKGYAANALKGLFPVREQAKEAA